MHPCRLRLEISKINGDFGAKELKEISPNYLSCKYDVNLIGKISADFYSDFYQMVEYETYKHEANVKHYKRQTVFVAMSVACVFAVLIAMLFESLPIRIMQAAGVLVLLLLALCLLLLGVETRTQIRWCNQCRDIVHASTKKIKSGIRKIKNIYKRR